MKYNYYPVLIALCLFSGCQSKLSPSEVSDKFWLGVKTANVALIKKMSAGSLDSEQVNLEALPQVKQYEFGKIIIDGDKAEIETKVSVLAEDKLHHIPVNTYLINVDGLWKVEYQKTTLPLTVKQDVTELFGDIQELSDEIGNEIKVSVEEFKEKALPEIRSKIQEAEKEIKEKLPELKNIIDEFLKDLEKSIEEAMPVEEEEVQTQET